jgi:hypothetical protein
MSSALLRGCRTCSHACEQLHWHLHNKHTVLQLVQAEVADDATQYTATKQTAKQWKLVWRQEPLMPYSMPPLVWSQEQSVPVQHEKQPQESLQELMPCSLPPLVWSQEQQHSLLAATVPTVAATAAADATAASSSNSERGPETGSSSSSSSSCSSGMQGY